MPDEPARTPHPEALIGCERAVMAQEKLVFYALDPLHPKGGNKARVFKSALGFEQEHWESLRDQILAELPYHKAELGKQDEHGQRYSVVLPVSGPNGMTKPVLTAWILEPGNDQPRLTTILVAT
jgi:hypothetical protein